MASTSIRLNNIQDHQLQTQYDHCDVQSLPKELASLEPTCADIPQKFSPSRLDHDRSVLRCHSELVPRSRSCHAWIVSHDARTSVQNLEQNAEPVNGNSIAAKESGLKPASTLQKYMAHSGSAKTVVIVEDVDTSSDEEDTHGVAEVQAGYPRKVVSSEMSDIPWQRGRLLIRTVRGFDECPSTSPTKHGSSSLWSSDSRPSDLIPSALVESYRSGLNESFPSFPHLESTQQPAFGIPMQREQDLSRSSGTLVDDERTVDLSLSSCSSWSNSSKTRSSHWREPNLDEVEATSMTGQAERRLNRSCSNNRGGQRARYAAAKSHPHHRHSLARYRPMLHVHQFQKTAETSFSSFNVYTMGIKELLQELSQGRLTCVAILDTYLRQIDRHNDTLRAIVHLAPREQLYRLARQRDVEISMGRSRGALHGIPILVKDNIGTEARLGMPTTAGSFALMDMPVIKDAHVVKKLREAGAIIIGKANMSELADYKSRQAGPGWSAVGGQTINVYAAHASPGTSSAGNGVAVAAGFCPASVGTETDGSITLPCLQSALYGLKPTVGMLSRTGIIPFAPTFDTAGPMAKTVWDLALLMDVMQGADSEDPITLSVERLNSDTNYIQSTVSSDFSSFRIGIPRQNWHDIDPWKRPGQDELSPEISEAFERALRMMQSLGAHVMDPANIPSAIDGSLWRCADTSRSLVVAADCKEYLGRYLQGLGGDGGCRSVEDIIAFNLTHADIELPPGHIGQEVLERTLQATAVDSPEYLSAKQDMLLTAGKNGLDWVFDQYGVDALFMIREGHHSLANMVGYPIGTVPLGSMSDGVPIGAFFIGRKHGEATLLAIMSAWESALGGRPLPPMSLHPDHI